MTIIRREINKLGKEICSSSTSSTTNLSWSLPELKPGLCGENVASNRLITLSVRIMGLLNKCGNSGHNNRGPRGQNIYYEVCAHAQKINGNS
jgi:hypothetical protein